ncbi:uncharacterized protein BYT42DRAFT_493652 [Radiomyces spectabilis]|uniref:uncharacterized protein n=1 Tax=Radiomyces spectabilis TaxID=64574 RepID=UPI002220014F|nr:uncharacterized protein BYT42DRAFT_493652 [Radiomyces spectabilis]KAI8385044.1 hypothetical protein BYT42DRAFT_493652 [Radiomyces spectabilis]
MFTQLRQMGMNDRRYKYNTDGILKANDLSALEILLTEVSSEYGSNDTAKNSFGHHKAMFGTLAMLRTLAQSNEKASFKAFSKLKVHFLHAHSKHWSMSTPASGIYVMNKEQRVEAPVRFPKRTSLPCHSFRSLKPSV